MGGIICIHQPPFLPWLGVVESMLVCDIFVCDDDAQFEDGGFQNRNRIKTAHGVQWLTVPVLKHFGEPLKDVKIAPAFDTAKIARLLQLNYSKAPHYAEYATETLELLAQHSRGSLVSLNRAMLAHVKSLLSARCEFATSDELGIPLGLPKEERLPALCRGAGCSILYSGSATRQYMGAAAFAQYGIRVIWHEYESRHAVYPQQWSRLGFKPCLGYIDMLFNCGAEEMRERLTASGSARIRKDSEQPGGGGA